MTRRPSLTAASADSDEPSRSGPFNLGRTGRRIAVGAAVVAAFFSGMILYGALDDRDSDGGRPELVSAPDGESGMPGMPPGGCPRHARRRSRRLSWRRAGLVP